MTTSYEHIQIRRAQSLEFIQANPILKSGEPAFAIDDGVLKVGDGVTPWNDLDGIGTGQGQTSDSSIVKYSYFLNATPAILSHSTYTLVVDAPDILSSNAYSILTSPSRAFYDGMVIAYAYVSNDNEISIKLTNTSSNDIPFENNSLIINTAIILMDQNQEIINGPNIVDPSAPSITTTTTTLYPTALPAAVIINNINQFVSGGTIHIFLVQVNGSVTDYLVEFSTNSGASWTNINHDPGIKFSGPFAYLYLDNPIYGATYSFRARAQNSVGLGDYGPTVTFATLTTTLAGQTTTSGPTTTTTSGPTTTTTTTTSGPTTTTTSGPTTTTTTSVPNRAVTFAAYGRRTLTYTHPLYNSTSALDTGTVNVGTGSNPSYYGTYDQDGNVYELIEDFNDSTSTSGDSDQTRIALGGDVFVENGFERISTGNYVYFNKIPKGVVPIKPITNALTAADLSMNYFGLRLVRNTQPPSNELNTWCQVSNISNPADTNVSYNFVINGNYINTKAANYLNRRANAAFGGIGSVNYDYWIKKVPVTYSEYITYLNIVDPNGLYWSKLRYCIIGMQFYNSNLVVPTETNSDTGLTVRRGNYLLYSSTRAVGNKYYVDSYHLNKPVYSLNWTHAARYCNWIHNGKGNADTENGAYDLRRNEEISFYITRQNAEIAAIPTLNEWYKAAYYNPSTASYYKFATQSNRLPQACSQNISTGDGIVSLTQDSIYVHYPL